MTFEITISLEEVEQGCAMIVALLSEEGRQAKTFSDPFPLDNPQAVIKAYQKVFQMVSFLTSQRFVPPFIQPDFYRDEEGNLQPKL